MKFNNSQNGRQGFTLIELLTVIAIIALLATLLFPSMAGAVARARVAGCQSNLRQIGAAVALNAADNDQQLPRYQTTSSSRHFWWGYYAVGLEWALVEDFKSTIPSNTNYPTGNRVFLCPASTVKWDQGLLQYRARGMPCMNNTYEGNYYNYKLSTLNNTGGDPDAGAVPGITKFNWYTSPTRMPFQWCSVRLTTDPVMAANYNVNVLAARSWHGEQERPVLFLDGHVKNLVRPEYTQHAGQALLTAKMAPNINYKANHAGWNNAWNGGDFAIVEY